MEVDETGIHERLMQLRSAVLEPEIKSHGGRIVKHTGDGFMAMFETAAAALHSAKAMQGAIFARELSIAADRRIAFRMGLNVSDVIVEAEDVYGDGVNIAARLQTHAEPGGIVISEIVTQQAGSLLDLESVDLGQMHLRNHANPVRVLSLRLPGAAVAAYGDATPGQDARPSIAVLPFRKLATTDGYFADGFVDNIIHALAGLKELFVISRGSTLGYRGASIDARAIGRELGVRYVLHGSVQRSGGRIRVTTELSDAETGEVIRPDHYDGDISDIFAFQDRIAEEVAKTIAPRVRDRELKRALRKHPQNMTAYDLVLEALEPLYRLDYASFARARGLLQRAMTTDPNYAPAYSYAAYWHIFRIGQEWSTDFKSDVSEAARLSEAAIACDGNDATALAIYGYVQGYLKKDFNEALRYLNRAIATSPSCSTAYTFSGATFCFLGDGPTSVRHAIEGLRISPLDTHVSFAEHILAQAYYVNGKLDDAIAWAIRADKHNARLTSNLRTLIASYAATDRLEEARALVRRHAEIVPAFRVSAWAARTPMQGAIRSNRIKELLAAGMPD